MKELLIYLASISTLLLAGSAFAAEPCGEKLTKYINDKYCHGAGVASCSTTGVNFSAKCNPPPGATAGTEGASVSGTTDKMSATPVKTKK